MLSATFLVTGPHGPITHQRIDVLADSRSETLEAWLRGNRHVEVVVRDGSTAYAEAIRWALPGALPVSDR